MDIRVEICANIRVNIYVFIRVILVNYVCGLVC